MFNESKVVASVSNKIIDEEGNVYNSIRHLAREIHVKRERISQSINENGCFTHDGHVYILGGYTIDKDTVSKLMESAKVHDNDKDYVEYKKLKEQATKFMESPIEKYDFDIETHKNGTRYCVALLSDAHVEQKVESDAVLNKNEYNLEIAEKRIKTYFNNLVLCLNDDKVDNLILACLGDMINGTIHESYFASNTLMPPAAIHTAEGLIYSGIKFILENTKLKRFLFIGIVGNHGRTTKKTWSNGSHIMNYETLMYEHIRDVANAEKLPVEFIIPKGDKAVLDLPGNRFLFEHGDAIRSKGIGVCGIYPALGRYRLKMRETVGQTKLFIGHFHQCCQITGATVNGSIVGFDNYALRNGFAWERPAQMYEVYDSSIGLLNTRQIYCDK